MEEIIEPAPIEVMNNEIVNTKIYKTRPQKTLKGELSKFRAISYQKTDTIKITSFEGKKTAIETDTAFIKSIQSICKQKENVLQQLINSKSNALTDLQCEQIHYKAYFHGQANIINRNSHRTKVQIKNDQSLSTLFCRCGCSRMKGQKFPLSHDMQEINMLGSGILLFFMFMKYATANLFIFVLLYAIYAIAINLLGTQVTQNTDNLTNCTSSYCFFRDQASAYNRINGDGYSTALSYVGLLGMVVWSLIVRFLLQYGRYKNNSIDKHLTSASDYAIKINNLPYQQYNEEELFEYLQKISKEAQIKYQQRQHEKKLKGTEQSQLEIGQDEQSQSQYDVKKQKGQSNAELQKKKEDHLDIKSVQIIYNMEFSRKMIMKIHQLCYKVQKQIKKRHQQFIIDDKDQYIKLKYELVQTYEAFNNLRKKFLNDGEFRKKISTRTAIIEFKSKKGKNKILSQYSIKKINFIRAIKQRVIAKCFGQSKTQLIFKGQIPQLMRSPEPSDIIWQNCQKKESFLRILIIYFITFIIILLSFGIIVGLQYIVTQVLGINQTSSSSSSSSSASSLTTIINIIISIVLQVINKVLWLSMFYLLKLEYNHTNTSKIISQMGKALVAMCINIIILPIIVNYGFSSRLYGAIGIAGIVFDYHISAVTINLILQLINPVYFILQIGLTIKCIRTSIIKTFYFKAEGQEGVSNQMEMKKIYKLYEGPEFDIAQSYVFIASNIFHAFFFCQLQPFILILVLIQSFFFFWICKIKILKMCKIPLLVQLSIFESATYHLMLVPVFYGTGGIFISYVRSVLDPTQQFQFIAYSICIAIGLLNYFNPKNLVQQLIKLMIRCCNCLKPYRVVPQIMKKTSILSIQGNQIQQKEKRHENYYQQSNSITLLGFQKKLLGEINFKEIEQELKNYCCSHVSSNNNREDISHLEQKQDSYITSVHKHNYIDKSNDNFI